MKILLASMALVMSTAISVVPAAAQDVVLKFGHGASSKTQFHTGVEMFADAVSKRTDGKVKIEVYGDRQLGDDRQLLEGVQLGTIDGALVSTAVIPLSLGIAAFDAIQLPFQVDSYQQLGAALTSDAGKHLLETLQDKQIVGLGFIEAGQRHFLSATKPVETLADFSGLKTRIVPLPLHQAVWKAVGVNTIGLAYGEIFSALETHTIDAVEINLTSILGESLSEAAKSLTLTGHYFWPGALMISKARFDSLPEDVQNILVEEGMNVTTAHYELAAGLDEKNIEALKEKGVTVMQLQGLDEMRARMEPVVEEWIAKDPLIKEFNDKVVELRNQ